MTDKPQPIETYYEDTRAENNLGPEYAGYVCAKQLVDPVPSSRDEMWRHMKSLPQIKCDRLVDLPFVHGELRIHIDLPRVRNFELNPKFTGDFNVKWGSNSLALAVYLTGDEAEKPCKRCKSRSGPFVGCVLPAKSVRDQIASVTCANCRYNWQGKQCALYIDNRPRRAEANPRGYDDKEKEKEKDDESDETNHGEVGAFFQENLPLHPVSQESRADIGRVITLHHHPRRPAIKTEPSPEPGSTRRPDVVTKTLQPRGDVPLLEHPPKRQHIISTEDPGTDNVPVYVKPEPMDIARALMLLTAADRPTQDQKPSWETAPGYFHNQNGDLAAYSSQHLGDSVVAIPIHQGVSARMESIHPGCVSYFEAIWGGIQLCLIYGGAVEATISGERVRVSAGGLLKVPESYGFLVRNDSEIEVSMHVIMLAN